MSANAASSRGALLALYGGSPVRTSLLPYGRHCIREEDLEAVSRVLRSGWLTQGPALEEFEEAFAEAVGARFAIGFSSGTAALHGAVVAAEIEDGDEAITTPLTFCASANCILYARGNPLFADIREDTLTIDPDRIAEKIGPRTRAIIPVDYAGLPADLDRIRAIAERHALVVIEDASHALGARFDGKRVGSLSTLTTFSLHPVKHVAAGEGGVVTTEDPLLAARLRRFRSHGVDRDLRARSAEGRWSYDMVELGYNYRLSDIAAALAHSQLGRLQEGLERRAEIADRYDRELAELPGLRVPPRREGSASAWHLYPLRVDEAVLGAPRDRVIAALRAEGIGASLHYRPVHLHRFYRQRFGYRPGSFPISERESDKLVTIPLYPAMSDGDVDDVVDAVSKVVRFFGLERSRAGPARPRSRRGRGSSSEDVRRRSSP